MNYEGLTKNLPPLLGMVVLVLVLLFVLVNFGYLRACDIPGFSGIYYSIKGQPQIAIVHGQDGTGDYNFLKNTIMTEIHKAPAIIDVSTITDASALSNYQIVIVEHAKTISTQTLWAFQKYVSAGGRLVWIGDAGTALNKNDYVCQKIIFSYKRGYNNTVGPNQTQEMCLDWYDDIPSTLDNSNDGLCGKTFGDVVIQFIAQNQSIYNSISMGPYQLCTSEKDSYKLSNAAPILDCITNLQEKSKDITVENVNEFCSGLNYWNRGPSKTIIGGTVPSLDFSLQVLGIDFVKQYGANNMFMIQSGGTHPLTKGYETGASVDFVQYFGVSNVSLVDSSRFSAAPRTSTVMMMSINEENYPAVVVSTPYISINRNGLIVYYAFPPDDLIKVGAGLRLINNLFNFLMC
jgi:hypothetical protein